MRYFSGFSLKGEEKLFSFWIPEGETVVAGFSYGAIRAFEYAINTNKRIDRLILISPAFFQEKSEAFKKAQKIYFKKNPQLYCKSFLDNCRWPAKDDLTPYFSIGNMEELENLLEYRWKPDAILKLLEKGITIEAVFGLKDKITDVESALNFFEPMVTTYQIKEAGHILRPYCREL